MLVLKKDVWMLSRHKKKGYDGFKYFVKFVESLPQHKQKEILESAILEDPVYMTWIVKNMIKETYFFKLNSKECENFFSNFQNGVEVLAKGFFNTDLNQRIKDEFLPKSLIAEYNDIGDSYKNLSNNIREVARLFLVSRIRQLQDTGEILQFCWRLPSPDITNGHTKNVRTGDFSHYYENGQLALSGKLEKTRRAGEWSHFYENGELMALGDYEEDEKTGIWFFYYSNGEHKSEGEFRENLKEGSWEVWDHDGKQKTIFYKRGKLLSDK